MARERSRRSTHADRIVSLAVDRPLGEQRRRILHAAEPFHGVRAAPSGTSAWRSSFVTSV